MRSLASTLVLALSLTACSLADSDAGPAPGPATEHPSDGTGSPPDAAVERPDPVDAAVTFVASTDQLMGRSPIGRAEILRRLVATSALSEQVAALEAAASSLGETLGVGVDQLTWVEAPLTATLTADAGDEAAVDVWAVSILGAPDSGPPQQAWRTVHVDLALVEGDWKVAGATASSGPTPLANDLALPSGFDEFEVVADWPAAIKGVGL